MVRLAKGHFFGEHFWTKGSPRAEEIPFVSFVSGCVRMHPLKTLASIVRYPNKTRFGGFI
jgi:hypothetical protein